MNKKLGRLKKTYDNISIPKELDEVVQKSIENNVKPKKPLYSKWLISIAAAVIMFVFSINASQTFAESLSKVPVVGSVVEVLTIREIHVAEENYNADIKIPAVNNLEDNALEDNLNQKYIEENEQLYQEFTKEMEKLEENKGGHLAVNSSYEVKTDDERIFSIERTVEKTEASSYTTHQYDTIDKQNKIMLTLPILFQSEEYIDSISEEIQDQMRKQMKEDDGIVYWVDEAGNEELNPVDLFDLIDANQKFYINENHKLVISFDEYEVAPGYMGSVEFVIPTAKIDKHLVGNEYIQ